ncbi:ATP-binding cassette domain-containing protein [Altererythrobacter confluentis]|uniref:ATP-binding cassette domain-containing protein n=1 Tax=Allopontixanthobacter confluentis TaxID=1849021 RepID=A0A6L7GIK7_9SPHN|nr:ABC transporter transmembrane domain-containing protein [Allopontixanthobacter confluentis]MXP15415.1 ATP-binding cassette domain-containing protein [Allopontixanthobacter confluentis]
MDQPISPAERAATQLPPGGLSGPEFETPSAAGAYSGGEGHSGGEAHSGGVQPDEARPARTLGPLKMIWAEMYKYPGHTAMALLALLVTASATLAIPAGFKLIIDNGFSAGGDPSDIGRWFRYLLLIVVVLAIGTALRFYFVSWLGERVVADIRLKVQDNLLRLAPSFYEENSPKEISSRMTADTALIEQVVGTTVSVALRNVLMGLGGTAYLFWLAPQLTIWLVVAIPLIILPIAYFGRRVRNISRTSQDRVADVGAMVTETLGAMKIVQAFNQEARENTRFSSAVEAIFDTAKRRIMLRAAMTSIIIMFIFGSITLILWRGALGVSTGEISGGTIAAFVFTAALVAGAFGALTEVYGDLLRGAGAASRLNELLNEKPAIAPPARPELLPQPPRGSLSFRNVTFRYPTRLEVAALKDFSLEVEPGETVAIVGPSGAGKSTIFQLAERFYDPQAGSIRIDGVPLTSADPAEIRRRMALVPQDGILFSANARDNLRYGEWDATDEDIWEAARAANAETFLRDLPDGLDTYLGEGGARLSGGQQQRIAIARALLRDAPILLLDEATSALDAQSEQLVQQALDRLMENRTTLVIAHRLATVRKADRIVVLEGGQIVEQGTHAQLSDAGGLYARLASLQFANHEPG